MVTTTLNELRKFRPCAHGSSLLLSELGKTAPDDEPLPLLSVLESNGLSDCTWCMRALPKFASTWRHFALDCVEHLMEKSDGPALMEILLVSRGYGNLAEDPGRALALAIDFMQTPRMTGRQSWIAQTLLTVNASVPHIAALGVTQGCPLHMATRIAEAAETYWQTERLRKILTDGEWTPMPDSRL